MKDRYIAVHLLNDFSGSPLVLSNFLDVLIDNGFDVKLYTNKGNGFLSKCDCKFSYINYINFKRKIPTLLFYLYSQLTLIFRMFFECKIKSRNFNHKVVINTLLPFGAAIGAKFGGAYVIYYVHETSIKPELLKRFLKLVMRACANEVIFVSKYLESKEGLPPRESHRQHVVYNSLPKNHFPVLNIGEKKKFTIFMASSLRVYKGVLDFIEIAKTLEDNPDFAFLLALNSPEQEFNGFFGEIVFPPNIRVIRSPSDIDKLYAQSSLVLNLSNPEAWIETFGMTVIEAFSYGIPVIVPTVGGIAEIVEDGVNGFHISVHDKTSLIRTIKRLQSDSEFYDKMSACCLKSASLFSYRKFKNDIESIL